MATYESDSPNFFSYLSRVCNIVGDENIVEDGSSLDLPQVKSYRANLVPFVQLGVLFVFGVVNLRVHPWALKNQNLSIEGMIQ